MIRNLNSRREDLINGSSIQEFDSLRGSLKNLRNQSIGQSIRALLRDVLPGTPDVDFKAIYNVRSRLVHTGVWNETELAEALTKLDGLVPMVLEQLLERQSVDA